jgi:hypothetical protein
MSEQEAKNGPRMLSPRLVRNDMFEHHNYTLVIADAVSVHLTDRQARDLYQQLHEEFRPKATLTPADMLTIRTRCIYCGNGVANPGTECGFCAGSLAAQQRRGERP